MDQPGRSQRTTTRASSTANSSIQWRAQIKQNHLVSQISSILLQRHNWVPLLKNNLKLSSKLLTPSLFLQILYKTQTHPQISLSFFNWAKSHLKFQPDILSHCHVIQLCVGSGLAQSAKPILDSLLQIHPTEVIGDTVIQACRGKQNSQSNALSFVLEGYSNKGLFVEALKVFWKMRGVGCMASFRACHGLLDGLQRENEIKLAWCFYGAMIRDGFLQEKLTWSLVAQMLCKDGKFERIVKMLDMGIYNSVMYNAVVDHYSKRGDFGAVFDRLNEMCNRELDPGYSTYSSILDGACKHGNEGMIEKVMSLMVEKGLLPSCPLSECDSIIQKLCDLGKINAAVLFFKRACDAKIGLEDATYGYMLKTLSEGGRLEEAISLYNSMLERNIRINDSTHHALVNLLCKEDKSAGGCKVLRDIIRRGFIPPMSSLSKYITSQCRKQRWRRAEELLTAVLEKGLLPDSTCLHCLVMHYCRNKQSNKALELHNNMEKSKASLDSTTYEVLLDNLIKEERIKDAVRIFDYAKQLNIATSASYTIAIRALCRAKEMRRAMKLHDEMLELGLQPDKATYKSLILEFKPL